MGLRDMVNNYAFIVDPSVIKLNGFSSNASVSNSIDDKNVKIPSSCFTIIDFLMGVSDFFIVTIKKIRALFDSIVFKL